MITIGIDDTDIIGSPGTNQLARAIVRATVDDWRCIRIVRHQLLDDPRVPYTSKNGSASISVEPRASASLQSLVETCRRVMQEWFIVGSDPGLCVVPDQPPPEVIDFGRRCQRELVSQAEARELAARFALRLEGLGGTEGGVIGALAAVGLAATSDDGRIVQMGEWPDDLSGLQSCSVLLERRVEPQDIESGQLISSGIIDVGKHLRPNLRGGRTILFVRPRRSDSTSGNYEAVRMT